MSTLLPMLGVCERCAHFADMKSKYSPDGSMTLPWWACNAFPEYPGIPLAIVTGENDHTGAVEGDHGVRFKPKPKRLLDIPVIE